MDAALALAPAPAPIGHNSIPARDLITDDPAIVYRSPEVLAAALAEFRAEIAAAPIDLASSGGRDEIKSRSAAFSRMKVKIEDAGKALTEDWRKKTDDVNSVKSKVSAEFDKLRDDARKPLTEWEAAKKKRDDEIASAIADIDALGTISADMTAQGIRHGLEVLGCMTLTETVFGAFQPIAAGKHAAAVQSLTAALARIEQAEKDKAELDRLRAEQAEREAEAAHRAREEQEKAAAERRASEDAQRIKDAEDRARREADERAKHLHEAEVARIRAEEEVKVRHAEAMATQLKLEADQRAAAEAKTKAEDEARAENQKHRAKIMGEAKRALMDHTGANEEHAKCIVLAIVAGSIPHTSLKF